MVVVVDSESHGKELGEEMNRWILRQGKMHKKSDGPYILYHDARDRIHELTCALRSIQNYPRGPVSRAEIDRIVDAALVGSREIAGEEGMWGDEKTSS